MAQVKTRREAADAGERKYYTGKPCIHGHSGWRYTASGICCECNSAATAKYNKRLMQKISSRLQGHFSYPSHPDDIPALLAYAQALDIQRGRVPHVPAAVVAPPPFDEKEARRLALGKVLDLVRVEK